jgi:DNA-binding response OmpR family regulator
LLILLAERDPLVAELNDFFLRTEGYDVEIALSVEDAEEAFASHSPALSIVELTISGGLGRALCERLKQQRDTPLLCISALDLREQALAAGADAFLRKPVEPLRLVSTVKDLLGYSALTRPELSAAYE